MTQTTTVNLMDEFIPAPAPETVNLMAAFYPPITRTPRKRGAPQPCACGCGEFTKGGTWRPGHDAKHERYAKHSPARTW